MIENPTTEQVEFNEIGGNLMGSTYDWVVLDYNDDLVGRRGVETYDRMRRGDASVRTSLRVIKAPLMAAQWYIEPADDSDEARMHAEFVEWAWSEMSRTPIQVLWEAFLMLDFGYYAFEKVFEPAIWRSSAKGAREKMVLKWKKWGPRHPMNTTGWEFDRHGGVQALKQNNDPNGFYEVSIPIDRLLIFTLDEEGGNPEGISMLRSAYKHWYYKENLYKVDAIQKERHGIGIPRVKLPANATTQDKTLAQQLVKNLRTNEKAGIVQPSGWEDIDFVEPKGQPVDVLASAQHHDLMIKANVLAQFLNLGQSESGSRAVGSTQEDIFTKSIHYIADIVKGVVNKWGIPQLIDYNFPGVARYPQLRVRRIGDLTDLRAFSVAIRNFIEASVLSPDPELEAWLRDYTDLPKPTDEVMERDMEDRLEKSPQERTGENTAQRTELPTDGA